MRMSFDLFKLTHHDPCRMTLVLFRTRRRDECTRLREGVRRRVRKSRQKEAAGAADAGLMQIEWSEGEVLKFAGVVKAVERDSTQTCKDDLLDEMSLGGDRKDVWV